VKAARAKHVAPAHARPHGATPAHRIATHADPAPVTTSADTTPALSRPTAAATADRAPIQPKRAAAAAGPAERRPAPTVALAPGPGGTDLALLLTLVFAIGSAYMIGRYSRRHMHVRR
jgi:hypothetical protein